MRSKVSGPVSNTGYRSVFAEASEVWRRVIVNRETIHKVARDIRYPKSTISLLIRWLKAMGEVPPKSRLAVAAMLVHDATDADIAWAFRMPLEWAQSCRERQESIRSSWPVPAEFEYVELDPDDPTPEQIREMCSRIPRVACGAIAVREPGIRSFRFDHNATLVPQLAD